MTSIKAMDLLAEVVATRELEREAYDLHCRIEEFINQPAAGEPEQQTTFNADDLPTKKYPLGPFDFDAPVAAGEQAKTSDELAAFEKWRHTQADSLRRCGYQDAADKFIQLGSVQWAGWQARAALATQPAVTVEYEMDHVHQLAFEIGEPDDEGDGYYFSSEELEEFVEKLNTVRGAEHDQ